MVITLLEEFWSTFDGFQRLPTLEVRYGYLISRVKKFFLLVIERIVLLRLAVH